MEQLVWREVHQLVPKVIRRVLIPCGALEAHGSIGLGTDTIIPSGIANALAPELDALIAPPISYGVLRTLGNYPGSVSVSQENYLSYVLDIAGGLVNTGFCELLFINGHAGNHASLKEAAFRLHSKMGVRVLVYDWFREVEDTFEQIYDGPGCHSGAAETGLVTAIDPNSAPEKIWNENDAGALIPSISAYPGPFTIILEKENIGLPDNDPDKARKLFSAVVEEAKHNLKKVLERWEHFPE